MDHFDLRIRVDCPSVDEEELARLTRVLYSEIAATDVDDVRPLAMPGSGTPGAKSAGAVTIGTLVVTLAPVAVGSLMSVVSSWLSRQPSDVEIEMDGVRFKGRVTKRQREELVSNILRKLDSAP
ncbi:hypothetical protein [Actinoplanes sp. NPDC049802]|uniref:hypothetical protein n=1 Tax=Actinoplanes sp. NPDC049802 TaxID=3154742 RepID=UPI00340DC6AB